MHRKLVKKLLIALLLLAGCLLPVSPVSAAPFGQGVFGANVPFGASTSLAIDVGSNVSLALSPSGGNFSGTGSHTVTITSTDVVGYLLYAHLTDSSAMTNGSATIPASSNSTTSALSLGTWGYNTIGSSTNFLGMSGTGSLLKDAAGPYKNGDPTTVTYGAFVSGTQPAGNYSVAVTYVVVAKNQ